MDQELSGPSQTSAFEFSAVVGARLPVVQFTTILRSETSFNNLNKKLCHDYADKGVSWWTLSCLGYDSELDSALTRLNRDTYLPN